MKQATEKEKEAMNATEWVDYYKACENELFSQRHLTIPRSIADWLDKAFEEYSEEGGMASAILSIQIVRNITKCKDIEEWFMHHSTYRLNLALAYLAGKAIGVNLVKVVE